MSRPVLSVEIDGDDALLLDLDRMADAVEPELRALNEQIGQLIEEAASGPTPYRTGYLLSSIFWEPDGARSIVVSAHAEYAPYVHRRVPFLLLAYQIAEPEIDRLLDEAAERIAAS